MSFNGNIYDDETTGRKSFCILTNVNENSSFVILHIIHLAGIQKFRVA